jgi:hypothetical protein
MDLNEPTVVFTTPDPTKAEVVQNYLADAGIPALVEGSLQAPAIGEVAVPIRVLVDGAHAEEALRLLAEHDADPEADAADIPDVEETAAEDAEAGPP